MKKSLIEALYFGDISPFSRRRPSCPDQDAVYQKIETEREYLKSRLSADDAQRLENWEAMLAEGSTQESIECFACGLKIGILLLCETACVPL